MTAAQNLRRIERDRIASSCGFDCHRRARQQAIETLSMPNATAYCEAAETAAAASRCVYTFSNHMRQQHDVDGHELHGRDLV
jgi:hypothetical protein